MDLSTSSCSGTDCTKLGFDWSSSNKSVICSDRKHLTSSILVNQTNSVLSQSAVPNWHGIWLAFELVKLSSKPNYS